MTFADEPPCLKKETPLYFAIESGDFERVKALIDKGADVNKMSCNWYPIHIAAKKGSYKIVNVLIVNKAAINNESAYGETPLELAVLSGKKDVVELLIKNGANVNPRTKRAERNSLHNAIEINYEQIGKILIVNGIDLNAVDNNGNTPLHYAAKSNRIWAIKLLVTHKAFLQVKNNKGETPYDIAEENGYKNILRLLSED